MIKILYILFIYSLLTITSLEQNFDQNGYCDIATKNCYLNENAADSKFLFYDVNLQEGFNLRRDVYMRFAILLAEARKSSQRTNWNLVLPPWHKLYHWRLYSYNSPPEPWGKFFDIESLKQYAPVSELYDLFDFKSKNKVLEIDTLYILQNFADPFEGGTFIEKWKINTDQPCIYDGKFWGYNNITVKEILCVQFQGKISKLWEILALHTSDTKVMFHHGEIPLHDTYGTKSYWDCRKSMKFNKELVKVAEEYISQNFDCLQSNCSNFVSIHWRRQDFSRVRTKDVPSISGTVKQINEIITKKTPKINKLFLASDASLSELRQLENELKHFAYKVYFYSPSEKILYKYGDGGIAIIDQIICSRAAYFIGTHESTFTFRIQEEREILGFDSSTTFNRLCPDSGRCEKPSKWTIVN